jgi:hypothetical protein
MSALEMHYGNSIHPDKFYNMKKTGLLTIVIFATYISYAQPIDNKINVYFGYSSGGFHGKEMIKENNYISPSLFDNFKNLKGLSLKALINKNQSYSIGLGCNISDAYNWELQDYYDYLKSGIKLYSLSPIIQFHNKFTERGLTNRIKAFIEIAPTIGFSTLILSDSLFDIQSESRSFSQPMKSNDINFGIEGKTGLELIITRAFGLYFAYSFHQRWVTSKFYPDKHFTSSQLDFGIFLRFKKDKRYFY